MKYKMKDGDLKVGSVGYRFINHFDYSLVLSDNQKVMGFTESKYMAKIMWILHKEKDLLVKNGVELCGFDRCRCVRNGFIKKGYYCMFRY